MISSVRGTVLNLGGSSVTIDVGGIGFHVLITPDHALALRVGTEATLVTTLIVRDDGFTLYGFESSEVLEVFTLLTGVSGVGPKSALGVIAELSPNDIAIAVSEERDSVFRKVTGIGPKTAKLIVVQLAGKVVPSASVASRNVPESLASLRESVVTALMGLGWNERVAREGVDAVVERGDAPADATVQTLLRIALAELGPNRGSAR